MNVLRTLTATGWLIAAILALTLVLLGWCALDARQDAAHAVRKADAGQTMAEGRTAAAQDASAVRDRADDRDDQITNAVNQGASDVRQSPDRSSANRATRLGVCRVNPSAGPDCRVLLADPERVD
ncbi:hypothetical protein [Brevundimonas sp. CEF1]|uniref:hypothetical protein n=1 Tax=Brevundimonas sp. CEF1 TaxID=3442642 RepID=UPI003F516EB3